MITTRMDQLGEDGLSNGQFTLVKDGDQFDIYSAMPSQYVQDGAQVIRFTLQQIHSSWCLAPISQTFIILTVKHLKLFGRQINQDLNWENRVVRI